MVPLFMQKKMLKLGLGFKRERKMTILDLIMTDPSKIRIEAEINENDELVIKIVKKESH